MKSHLLWQTKKKRIEEEQVSARARCFDEITFRLLGSRYQIKVQIESQPILFVSHKL